MIKQVTIIEFDEDLQAEKTSVFTAFENSFFIINYFSDSDCCLLCGSGSHNFYSIECRNQGFPRTFHLDELIEIITFALKGHNRVDIVYK